MVVFKGEISQKCKRYVTNKIVPLYIPIISVFPFWLWSIIMIFEHGWPFAIATASLTIFPLVFYIPVKKSEEPKIYPTTVSISDNGIIISESSMFWCEKTVEVVKAVIDCGDWYFLEFYMFNKSPHFVCQKDLISEGTIEEFEKIFDGKIIRRK